MELAGRNRLKPRLNRTDTISGHSTRIVTAVICPTPGIEQRMSRAWARAGEVRSRASNSRSNPASWVIDGPMNRELFELHVETQLAPTLRTGDVIIPDNLSSPKSPKAAEAMRAVGAWFLFLPPCRPDLNPEVVAGFRTSC